MQKSGPLPGKPAHAHPAGRTRTIVSRARRLVAERFGCSSEEAEQLMVRYASAVEKRLASVARDLLEGRNRGVILDGLRDSR